MLIRNPSCACISYKPQKCVEYTTPKVLSTWVIFLILLLEVLLSNTIDQRETKKDLNLDFKQLSFCKIPYKNNIQLQNAWMQLIPRMDASFSI